ncbi:MAG: hypothetical protein ACK5TN_01545 [Acidobacteriota bacterium]|jgi:hypothetical protein
MRTTLTLDPDVSLRLQEKLKEREGVTMKQLVNEALRLGLANASTPRTVVYKVNPFPLGLKPGIDPDKVNQILDELASELTIERLRADS